MALKDLHFERSYSNRGKDNFVDNLLIPALKESKEYKRSVGFFSSGVFSSLMDGVSVFIRNGGTVQLIASPKLSAEDSEAISLGYKKRDQVANDCFTSEFEKEVEKLDDTGLQILYQLISERKLDIKIAITDKSGMYHDKSGILKDSMGNYLAFCGSPNDSRNAMEENYERVRVFFSWDSGSKPYADDEEKEFDDLWNGYNQFVEVQTYTETAEKKLIEIIERRKTHAKGKNKPIELYGYQKRAIASWMMNKYHGFYVMATGTGKTWTAIYSAIKLQKKEDVLTVICAPYKHLVKQWSEDIKKVCPNSVIILISSENPDWDKKMADAFIRKKYDDSIKIVLISTIKSFKSERFTKQIQKYNGKKLLIVDEAHRFTDRADENTQYDYLLGLSATPFSGSSAKSGVELMRYFGGQVYNLPIDTAIQKGFLVKYYYHPIVLSATEDEEQRFKEYSKQIASCFKNNICIDKERLVKALRGRLRVISMAEEKQNRIDFILDQVQSRDHFIVYCGDGKLFDDDTGEEMRHISSVKKTLYERGYRASQFTASENIKERMDLVESFNRGEISALAAIRCLDEGINIPSIQSALILSSNDDYREFVQRRGRILRHFKDKLGKEKEEAHIYDVIVLPSTDVEQWAIIELRRFWEYARLAVNHDDLEAQLNETLLEYGLERNQIDVYDFDDVEDTLDE